MSDNNMDHRVVVLETKVDFLTEENNRLRAHIAEREALIMERQDTAFTTAMHETKDLITAKLDEFAEEQDKKRTQNLRIIGITLAIGFLFISATTSGEAGGLYRLFMSLTGAPIP